jgi:CelD/BcsL family acetyltransferase involved in cellulose biosynthesis
VTLATKVIEAEADAAAVSQEWDDLAIAASRPFCAPAWALAWWRNVAPAGAALRIVTVRDGERLVGLAPFWADGSGRRPGYETMAAHLSPPAGPLAAPGREAEVAAALTEALAEASPKPASLRLEDQVGEGRIADLVAESWSGVWVHAAPPAPLPIVVLDGHDYESWLATKSSKFRQETRRLKRRLDDAGAEFGLVEGDGVERAVDAFVELHGARWEDRGGSNALVPGIREMLAGAARELLPSGRLRIYAAEVGDRIIAVNILVAAGVEVCGWNSGFDPEWGRYSPSLLLTLHALADAAERGEKRLSLGPGGAAYKRRMADAEEEVGVLTVVPRGAGYLRTRLGLVGHQLRWGLSRRLSPDAKQRLRRLARR